jgi:hypothetical protein
MTRFGISGISDTAHATCIRCISVSRCTLLCYQISYLLGRDLASCPADCGQCVQCTVTLIEVSSGLQETDESSAALTATRGLALCQTGTTIYTTSLRISCICLLLKGNCCINQAWNVAALLRKLWEVSDVDNDLLRVTFRNRYIKLQCFSFVWGGCRRPRKVRCPYHVFLKSRRTTHYINCKTSGSMCRIDV